VQTATTRLDLPAVLQVGPGIRLLPAEDYPDGSKPQPAEPYHSERMQ
jgi:hypothetical protein